MRALFSIAALVTGLHAASAAPGPGVAFFYGAPLPVEELSQFAQVVVDPDQAGTVEIERLRQRGAQPFAYLSVGEIAPKRAWSRAADRRFILGENRAWGSQVVDPRQAGWRALVVAEAARLRALGYRGLFLDTLDSYMLAVRDSGERKACAQALAQLVHAIKARVPDVQLLLNRGFEFLPEVAKEVSGVAAESLFRGWDAEKKRFVEVSEADRRWLAAQLARVRDRYHLPAIAIDYVPAAARADACATARRISALGFVPWVGVPALDTVGVGAVEVVPRRVLLVYDSDESPVMVDAYVHQLAAMPLEYLGYAVEYVDARGELPQAPLGGRYAGVVTWFTDDVLADPEHYRSWLVRQLDAGVPLAIIGRLGFPADGALLERLGLATMDAQLIAPLKVRQQAALLGFEAMASPHARDVVTYRARPSLSVQVSVEDAVGQRAVAVATGPFGGLAFEPFVITEQRRWILNPFEFVKLALRLPLQPAFDVTTESGRRLLMVHIDGDGFASQAELPGRPFAGQVVLDQVLKTFVVPTTVSIIEGEIGRAGLYPEHSAELEAIARRIFLLPNVQIASHSYSHPFNWEKATAAASTGGEEYHLAIPGYHFNLEREIAGSVAYINAELAPPGKRVQVFLWSGNALPGSAALDITHRLGLLDLNGGQFLVKQNPSLSEVSPLGRPVGPWFQTYAPIGNENLYTDLWRGPFYGFRRVIDTFRMTDYPFRIKPISIYYHFYSGAKQAALTALKEVYRWALAQEVLPIWVTDFVRKSDGFRAASIALTADGAWQLRGFGELRTVRLDPLLGWPDLERSRGVAGVRDLPQGRYVALTGEDPATLYVADEPPRVPYLESANAEVVAWKRRDAQHVDLHLRGAVPVRLVVAGTTARCTLTTAGKSLHPESNKAGKQAFALSAMDTGDATLACN
jgi:uncharacterized protein (TIGR01370 family)